MKSTESINPGTVYSARQALKFVNGFAREDDFRKFLKEDISKENIFNAKIYTINSQTRILIKGEDLIVGIPKLQKLQAS